MFGDLRAPWKEQGSYSGVACQDLKEGKVSCSSIGRGTFYWRILGQWSQSQCWWSIGCFHQLRRVILLACIIDYNVIKWELSALPQQRTDVPLGFITVSYSKWYPHFSLGCLSAPKCTSQEYPTSLCKFGRTFACFGSSGQNSSTAGMISIVSWQSLVCSISYRPSKIFTILHCTFEEFKYRMTLDNVYHLKSGGGGDNIRDRDVSTDGQMLRAIATNIWGVDDR